MDTLFVNKDFHHEVTLNGTMEELIEDSFKMTWNEFFENIYPDDMNEFMEDHEITKEDLNDFIDEQTSEKFYDKICYYFDNYESTEVAAYHFIKDLDLIALDKNGTGHSKGVELVQTLANGPRKEVYIEDEKAAEWLISECKKKNVAVEIKFI